ncbi:2232_t:CDS:2, partial [Dentiscutata erythropus]
METVNERNGTDSTSRLPLSTYSVKTSTTASTTLTTTSKTAFQEHPPAQSLQQQSPLQKQIRQDPQPLGFDKNDASTFTYQTDKSEVTVLDIKALVQSALEQAKVDPEVVYAAAQLVLLANQDRNNGYFVDANSTGILDVTANRPSAMSLSNLLLPDEADWTRFVCVSDTHNKVSLETYNVPEGDVLLHSGDLTEVGKLVQIEAAIDWIKSLPH